MSTLDPALNEIFLAHNRRDRRGSSRTKKSEKDVIRRPLESGIKKLSKTSRKNKMRRSIVSHEKNRAVYMNKHRDFDSDSESEHDSFRSRSKRNIRKVGTLTREYSPESDDLLNAGTSSSLSIVRRGERKRPKFLRDDSADRVRRYRNGRRSDFQEYRGSMKYLKRLASEKANALHSINDFLGRTAKHLNLEAFVPIEAEVNQMVKYVQKARDCITKRDDEINDVTAHGYTITDPNELCSILRKLLLRLFVNLDTMNKIIRDISEISAAVLEDSLMVLINCKSERVCVRIRNTGEITVNGAERQFMLFTAFREKYKQWKNLIETVAIKTPFEGMDAMDIVFDEDSFAYILPKLQQHGLPQWDPFNMASGLLSRYSFVIAYILLMRDDLFFFNKAFSKEFGHDGLYVEEIDYNCGEVAALMDAQSP